MNHELFSRENRENTVIFVFSNIPIPKKMVVRKLYLIKKSLANNTGFVSELSTSDLMADSLTNKLIDSNYNISDLQRLVILIF